MSGTVETLVQNFQNLGVQIGLLKDDLDQAKRSGYPLETARIQKQIEELESEREAINASVVSISQKQRAKEAEEERLTDHQRLVGECREGRQERDKLVKDYERKLRAWEVAGEKLSNAQSHCNQFMSNKLTPEDYPSPEELQVELERGTVLQTELSAAQENLRKANVARHEAQKSALTAARKFEELAGREIRLRPQNPPAPEPLFSIPE